MRDLEEIEADSVEFRRCGISDQPRLTDLACVLLGDVPMLLAEIRKLNVELETKRSLDEIVLPSNPWGTSAIWADYNWRQIADNVRNGRLSTVAAKVCDLIADALGEPS